MEPLRELTSEKLKRARPRQVKKKQKKKKKNNLEGDEYLHEKDPGNRLY